MRILFVTNMYPTPDEPWFGSFVEEQARDLRRLGVEVDVCSFDGRTRKREYVRAFARVRRAIASANYDLLHAHYGLSGVPALGQLRIPVVTTFHGSETGYIRWQKCVSWAVCRRCTPIFVSTQNATALGMRNAPVIPVGVDLDFFEPRSMAEVRRELGWDESMIYVVFPGARSNRRKRYDLFAACLAEMRRRTDAGVVAVPLEDLSREGVARVFQAADATLMTSDWEGSPVAVKESLACETPVVSVEVGDVATIVDRLPGCAIGPREPAELAQLLMASIAFKGDSRLRDRARRYDRLAIAQRLIAVYLEAAGVSPHAPLAATTVW